MLTKTLLADAALAATLTATAAAAEVTAARVTFQSGGQTLVGTLYRPAEATDALPGVVVGGCWTSVKEQMAGLYARELAERGFVTLAFDHTNFGESGGTVRELESAKLKIEDFRAAARFLSTRPEVTTGGVGVLGVCASAGYAAYAVAASPEVKSFGTVAAWLHDATSARAIYGDRYDRFLADGRSALSAYEADGEVRYVPAFSTSDPEAAMQMATPGYYGDPDRGGVPAWSNRFAQMGWGEWLTFDALKPAAEIEQPVLMIHSDGSALPDNVRTFHAALKGPKTLHWMEGNHLDFYDDRELVAQSMDVMAVHFRRSLR
jgi:uncharacterized protein